MAKAWGGRFGESTDKRVERFTESISFDARLAPYDIAGSKAHATMLAEVGLIDAAERDQLHHGLERIGEEIARGEFPFRAELEDIHMHIESALVERLGDVGRKLHTARSRNDQVATDLKLYVRETIDRLDELLAETQRAFLDRCEQDADVILPGYTHLQRAMPVLASHYWLAYCEKLDRDRQRLADCRRRVNLCPLGGAALAGTSLPIDRHRTAELLGFDAPAANSLDIASDRDFLAEFSFCLSLLAVHLSGWAEEWITWFSTEFGFLKLPDSFTTGSSIMPQKRNPDVPELIRGKSAGVIAGVSQILVLLKGLPLAYNRDLQEDKRPVFAAVDAVAACLELMPAMIRGAELDRERIAEVIDAGFLDATALMEGLIKRGVPMRSAHEIVGKLVAQCEQSGRKRLSELSDEELREAHGAVDESIRQCLGTAGAAQVLSSYGSGGAGPVAEQVARWRDRMEA